jgi:hypothetical protein
MIVTTKLTLGRFPHRQKTNKKPRSVTEGTDSFSPVVYILQIALLRLVLQFVEIVLLAIEPHEGYGSGD